MIKKILIVDDSPIARKMLKMCIPKDKEYEIYEAVDGLESINKYQEILPDVTFMDLTMPEFDGYQAIAEIRKISDDAIIVVTTADVQRKSISRVIELGAFLVLKKPLKQKNVQETLIKVENALENRSGGK
ncbi:response regulator [Desulfonema magnum]|uniref:Two component system response regulator n=1 Tax=Desulfonema magnum TaxID=45655 RepID=A0A975BK17_9BACT|nr:response regulator [Desulfonema magnum]QTA86911.1 Two component system response regulator [Desulfonema magnum]